MATRNSGNNNGPPLSVRQAQDAFVGANRRAAPAAPRAAASVPSSGQIPTYATAAQHSDAARALSKQAALHSARASSLARDQQRQQPPSRRTQAPRSR
jgi:hypothetical protein